MSKSSPFESVHEKLGAEFGQYHGWRLPKGYGDLGAESKGLYDSCAAFDLSSFGKISIKGPAGRALVDTMLGNDTEKPSEGRWIWGWCSDEQGDVVDNLRVGWTKDGFMLFTTPRSRETVLTLAEQIGEKYKKSDVQIADITEKTGMLGIYGPKSPEAVANILPFDIADMGQGDITSFSMFMMSITIIRGSWVGLCGVELLCPASVCQMAAGAVEKYHKREGIVPAGMDCLKTAMAEAAMPFDKQIALF